MTSSDEAEIVFDEAAPDVVPEVDCDSLPFWVALSDGDGKISYRLVRAWVFAHVHSTPEVPLTVETIGYMEGVTQWLINGVTEEIKLKVVKK
jgi:hypothetical protein